MKTHKWKEQDDIVTLYLYKFGINNIPYTIVDISNILGMSTTSLRMRIANFKALDRRGGLYHYAQLSEKIYNEYKEYPESELRNIVINILSTMENRGK